MDIFCADMEVAMLTGKQRSYLRSLSNNLQPIFQVGKGGVSDNMIKQFSDALEARELIKATVLKNAECDTKTICEEIAEQTNSQIVQVIGSKFVLYKPSEKNSVIELP